jgi:CheY-like chemotaxis protein/HPt (histidine-containing phosphotransfer) domain-containing protein
MANFASNDDGKFDVKKICTCNILLAEDNLLNIKLHSILFTQNGIPFQVAENGREAVEKVKLHKFDVVLMDLEMPVMDGYLATTIIRQELHSSIPIIAMTAHTRTGEKEKCLRAGMNAYLSKPVDPEILFATIHNVVSSTNYTIPEITNTTVAKPVMGSKKLCDLDYLIKATRGNHTLLNKVIKIFLQQIPEDLAELNEAIGKTKFAGISDASHKLNSSFSMLGVAVLKPVLEEIEQLGNMASGIEKIMQLNYRVNTIFRQVIKEIAKKSKIRGIKALNV